MPGWGGEGGGGGDEGCSFGGRVWVGGKWGKATKKTPRPAKEQGNGRCRSAHTPTTKKDKHEFQKFKSKKSLGDLSTSADLSGNA